MTTAEATLREALDRASRALNDEALSMAQAIADAQDALDSLEAEVERLTRERDELRKAAQPFLSLWISPKAYQRLRDAIGEQPYATLDFDKGEVTYGEQP